MFAILTSIVLIQLFICEKKVRSVKILENLPYNFCRLIVEKRVVYEKFPIPLINRLEKHFLKINTMLTREQHMWIIKAQTNSADTDQTASEEAV